MHWRKHRLRNRGIWLLCLCWVSLSAQEYIAQVQYFGVENGLSHRQVNAIFQDSRGFVWIGTPNGLNRFDGYTFRHYSKGNRTLPFNSVLEITEDTDGWLWILEEHRRIICLLHPDSGIVHTLAQHLGKTDSLFARDQFRHSIIQDADGALWLSSATTSLLYRYHPDSGVQRIPLGDLSGSLVQLLRISGDGSIWVQVDARNILQLSRDGSVLQRLDKTWVYGCGAITGHSMLCRTTENANTERIVRYNLQGELMSHLIPNAETLEQPYPALIFPFDEKGSYVIHDKLFDPEGKTVAQWTFAKHDRNHFLWRCFVKDSSGRYWLGDDFGFYILEINKNRFHHYYYNREAKPGLGNSMRGMVVTEDKLFATLEDQGLYTQDLHTSEVRRFPMDRYPGRLYGLYRVSQGDIYLGGQNQIWHFSSDAEPLPRIETDFETWTFHEDSTGILWLGTNRGLHMLTPDDQVVRAFSQMQGSDTLGSSFVLHITQAPSGTLWVCSNTGFYTIDPKGGTIARYWSGGTGDSYLPTEQFLHVHQDADGTFWFATANGLVRCASQRKANGDPSPHWDPSTGKVYSRANGLPNDFLYAVYEDRHGALWLPSNYGLIRLDKDSEQVRTYGIPDGLTNTEFNRLAHAQGPDGTLYFGGLNGINAFHPDDFRESDLRPSDAPLVLTAFHQPDPATNRIIDRTTDLVQTKTIVLHPRSSFIHLEVALLSFENPELIHYAWRIDNSGEASEWHYQKERQFNFGGLPYGTHTLHIKAQGADGRWSGQEMAFTVRSLPPWYLRTWFLVLASVLFIIGIRGFILWRNRQQILERKKLESRVAQATERIEQDKRTIEEQANELRRLDRVKSNFFANVSHELRTPLTLMLGPVHSMLKSGELSSRNLHYANLIRQNGEQLLQLVGELLDLQKLESGKLELQPKPTLFYPLLKRIAGQFESFAQNKSIAFVFLYRAEKLLQIEVDASKLELVLNNLLSNAMKFTPPDGKVEFLAEDLGHSVRLTVSDTGVGIHPDDLPHVFDRFYQSHQNGMRAEGGTGIGLALVRELSVVFGGTVQVKSPGRLGAGSTFAFEFPKTEIIGAPDIQAEVTSIPEEQIAVPATTPVITDPKQDPDVPTVLLVEDNPDLRTFLSLLLTGNYHIVTAENGREALEYLSKQTALQEARHVDLIVSDIMMPVMDGFQFLEQLRSDSRFRQIPIIMLTARADIQDKLRALRIGVDDYLLKPFVEEELMARIAALLERYRERLNVTDPADPDDTEPESPPADGETALPVYDTEWLESLENIVTASVQNDQLSVSWIADQMHLSERHFQRKLKALVGLSPNAYIREVRLQEARRLLEQGHVKTVKEAAWAVSFRDEKYFAQIFKDRFGVYPSKMRGDEG